MTIQTTENNLILTGVEPPIATLEIDGQLVDFTAYDGTLASVTAGTPYTLTLDGFAVQGDAFTGVDTPIDVFVNLPTNIMTGGNSKLYEKPLPVGKTDSYTLSVSSDWLGGASVSSFSVSLDGFNLVSQLNNSSIMQVFITSVQRGRNAIHWSFTLDDGRSECATGYIDSPEC